MARVAGRLFGVLLVSAEPRSLDELAEQLGVSKASVSINIRFLEEKGAVERIGRQGDRRDYYRIAEQSLLYQQVHREVRRALTRRFPYAVYFIVEGDRISILRVLHQARDPDEVRRGE